MRRNELGRWALVTVVAVLALGVWRAGANNNAMAPQPPVIALVNLESVVNKLDEVDARKADLDRFATERQQKITELQKKFEELRTTLQILPKDSPEAKQAVEDLLRLQMTAEFENKLSGELLDQKKGEIQAELFEKTRDAVDRIARQRGYNLVLSHDGDIEILRGQEIQVQRQLANRRILFADQSLDISAEVLQMMNNEWRALGGAAAAPAGGARPSGR